MSLGEEGWEEKGKLGHCHQVALGFRNHILSELADNCKGKISLWHRCHSSHKKLKESESHSVVSI